MDTDLSIADLRLAIGDLIETRIPSTTAHFDWFDKLTTGKLRTGKTLIIF